MPKTTKKEELHIRLSKPASERLKELEELSGFSGSRLIEEIIMAIYDVLYNYSEFDLMMADALSNPDADVVAIILMFSKGMETILDRIGYSELLEIQKEERKKLEKKLRKK